MTIKKIISRYEIAICRNAQTRRKIHGVYHMTIKKNKYLHMK